MKPNHHPISPLLRHALESFEHGMEHFQEGSDSSRNFAFLHVDQTIELLIKEKLVRLGKSIYKSDGTTINLHEAFNSITKDVPIPERPRLEGLHDLRNNIQHMGLAVDVFTTAFYMTEAYNFINRFLSMELDIKISEFISSDFLLSGDKAILVDSSTPNPNTITDSSSNDDTVEISFEETGEYININRSLLPQNTDELFAFHVQDDKMQNDTLVYKGDILIIRKSSEVKNGEMFLFKNLDEQLKLRYFYHDGEKFRLQPANQDLEPEHLFKNELQIIGKVIMVIRHLKEHNDVVV